MPKILLPSGYALRLVRVSLLSSKNLLKLSPHVVILQLYLVLEVCSVEMWRHSYNPHYSIQVRQEMVSASADVSARLERVQAELASMASKTQVEIAREEVSTSEQRVRQALDEQRGKVMAQELIIQGLSARLDSMERAERERELKVNSELSASSAQLSQLNAAVERLRGDTEARLSEQSARAGTQHDALLTRLGAAEEDGRQLQQTLATKSEVSELAATVHRRAGEADAVAPSKSIMS